MARDFVKDDEVRALERVAPEGPSGRDAMVPAAYAEKAMSSLMSLHRDLVEEKERRIDLYRRLMEREQSLAELRAYVKLLENELARTGFDPAAVALDPLQARTSAPAATPGVPGGVRPAPAGAAPAGATPAGAAPAGATPAGATPAGATPAGATPAGATPAGATPAGATPAGAPAGAGTEASPRPVAPSGPGPVVAWTPVGGAKRDT